MSTIHGNWEYVKIQTLHESGIHLIFIITFSAQQKSSLANVFSQWFHTFLKPFFKTVTTDLFVLLNKEKKI